MRNFLIIGCLVGLVTGCGGGSSSSNTSVSPTASTSPKVGDTYVYEDTTSSLGTNSTFTTNVTRKIDQIGSTNELTVSDYYSTYNIYSFDLSEINTNVKSNTGCSFSPAYNILPTPWSVGETSNQNIV